MNGGLEGLPLPSGGVGGRLRRRRVISTSGVYNKPAWLAYADVTVVGGGANGGSSSASFGGGGGGAGGAARKLFRAAEIPSTVTCTVAVASSGAGNTTSFGTLLSATGGSVGGAGGTTAGVGGAGGVGTGGDINITGGAGVYGMQYSGATDGEGGKGGDSLFGGGARNASRAAGLAGSSPGGGGSGGGTSGGALSGGQGASGVIIVEEYE